MTTQPDNIWTFWLDFDEETIAVSANASALLAALQHAVETLERGAVA